MHTEGDSHSQYPFLCRAFQFVKCVPWWCLLVVAIVTAIFFWRVLFFGEHIAFRDGAHFYPSLFEYIQSEWQAGRVSLWNPYENLGQPLMANPVSSVFYPAKLIYFLPISPYHAYHMYVIGHLLLAALTCYRLARQFQCSVYAATIATLAYVFGGSVLFQYSNVVFLVGAAWLPEAITQASRLIATRRIVSVVGLGLVFAMFVLGGDPQMAYHALVLILLLLLFYRRQRKKSLTDSRLSIETNSVLHMFATNASTASAIIDTSSMSAKSFWSRPIMLICYSLLFGSALAAVQWLPAIELGAIGDRNLEDKPVSVWRSIVVLEQSYREHNEHQAWDQVKDGLTAKETQQSGMAKNRYNFSVGPWRLIEFVWPNANGRMFPIHTNWGTAIGKKWPSCSGIWSPSLYMGIIPFLLAIIALRFRKSNPLTLWLSWSFLIFLVGSLGYFGLGWVVNQVIFLWNGQTQGTGLGSPFGGIYWLFSLLLPGYDQFRYPAKLLTVAALMLSILSARSFDAIFGVPDTSEPMHLTDIRLKQRKYRKSLLGLTRLLILISFLLVPLVLVSSLWVYLGKYVPNDPIFGGFVVDRALGEAAFSLMHVLNILFLFLVAVRIFSRQLLALERFDKPVPFENQTRLHERYFRRLGIAVGILVCCDVVASNHWMIATAQRHFFEGKPLMATFLDVQESLSKAHKTEDTIETEKSPAAFPIRTWRAPTYTGTTAAEKRGSNWLPNEFSSPSPNRMAEWVIWERASLSPRYPMAQRIGLTDVRGSVVTADYYAVSHILRGTWQNPRPEDGSFALSHYLELLGNSSMIVPASRNKTDYISQEQIQDTRLTAPIELLDQAAREEAESYRRRLNGSENGTEPEGDALPENETSDRETRQIHQWGREKNSITDLLPSELNYWPLNAAPRVYVVDRIRIEEPLDFCSREKYFAQTYAMIARSSRTNIPIVEWGSERFDHLPVRFAKSFAKLIAMGDLPRHRIPQEFEPPPVGETELVSYEPQKVVVRARINRSGFLILSDQYDANWRAEVRHIPEGTWPRDSEARPHNGPPFHDGRLMPPHDGFVPPPHHPPPPHEPPQPPTDELRPSGEQPPAYHVPILRTNRVLRGVPLPEGEWEVTFVYNPLSFRVGAYFSFIAWVTLAMFLLGIMAKKIKQAKMGTSRRKKS